MDKLHTDWNLVVQAQVSVSWLFECLQKGDEKISDALREFQAANGNCDIINPGILMAYAYMVFVYPKATSEIDISSLDFLKFTILEPESEVPHDDILRRLRNSIAHGRFSIAPDATITFEDNNNQSNDPFKAQVSSRDFGSFIQTFCKLASDQHLKRTQ